MGKPSQRELARRKPRLRELTPETQHMSKFKCSRTRKTAPPGQGKDDSVNCRQTLFRNISELQQIPLIFIIFTKLLQEV